MWGEKHFVIGGKNNGEPYFHAYKQAPVGRSIALTEYLTMGWQTGCDNEPSY